MNRQDHWSSVWADKSAQGVSWYQPNPELSLELIDRATVKSADRDCRIIDVGGGASLLADKLLERGFTQITVLDIAENALATSRRRLGPRAGQITWVCEDILQFQAQKPFDIWHDRACFHFLTQATDRALYLQVLRRSLTPGGEAIIATFAVGGARRCSGLPVVQYDTGRLLEEMGQDFRLEEQAEQSHFTPGGAEQLFCYFRVRYCC